MEIEGKTLLPKLLSFYTNKIWWDNSYEMYGPVEKKQRDLERGAWLDML